MSNSGKIKEINERIEAIEKRQKRLMEEFEDLKRKMEKDGN